MKTRKTIILSIILLLFCVFPIILNAASLEVGAGGEVSVNSKLNVNDILHLTPRSNPPENPAPGDMYFTTTHELLIYADGEWLPMLAAATAAHGSKHLTSGSGTWTVPAGIFSIQVTMTGGGGGGGGASYSYHQDHEYACYENPGGAGGRGGVRLNYEIAVTPGQEFTYSVGGGGSGGAAGSVGGTGGSTTFGAISVSGGSGGQGGGTYKNAPGASGSHGTPYEGAYPYGSSYGAGGAGGVGGSCMDWVGCFGNPGSAGSGGAIYIQY